MGKDYDFLMLTAAKLPRCNPTELLISCKSELFFLFLWTVDMNAQEVGLTLTKVVLMLYKFSLSRIFFSKNITGNENYPVRNEHVRIPAEKKNYCIYQFNFNCLYISKNYFAWGQEKKISSNGEFRMITTTAMYIRSRITNFVWSIVKIKNSNKTMKKNNVITLCN